jgi:hypothetical protein
MRRPSPPNDRGVALVMTIFALVVVGALVAGSFFVGRAEQLTGYNTVWAAQAGEAAEAGLSDATANLDAATYLGLPVWTPAAPNEMVRGPNQVSGMPSLVYTTRVRRLNQQLFRVATTGQKVAPGGRVLGSQPLVQLVRIAKPTIGVNAGITVRNPIKFNGKSFFISGMNALPPHWSPAECPPPDPGNSDDLVGVRSATTSGAGGNDLNNIEGFPVKVVENDPTITSETFRHFLDYTYATLGSQPGVKILPNTTPYNGVGPVLDLTQVPAVCDRNAPLNFGEPFRNPPTATAITECTGYFPTVRGTGAQLKFAAGSRGQGILLVDGDLELAGGFEWAGLIIVRGQMKITGSGNKITGAILTEGVDILTAGSVSGNVTIQYSACAVEKAVQGAASPRLLARGWAQAF